MKPVIKAVDIHKEFGTGLGRTKIRKGLAWT